MITQVEQLAERQFESRSKFRFPVPLHCPACGAVFETQRLSRHERLGLFGVLACDCARYPVVADIPILVDGMVTGARCTTARLCRLLDDDKILEALFEAVYPGQPSCSDRRSLNWLLPAGWLARQARRARRQHREMWLRAVSGLQRDNTSATVEALLDLYFGVRGIRDCSSRDYFTYRWSQPRHLAPLGLVCGVNLGSGPLLDVGCGAGHHARFLVDSTPGRSTVGVDRHFFLLFVARHYIAPSACYVCCDLQEGLPFEDRTFTAVICINTFHFLRTKALCAREFKRVLGNQGHIVLAALRQRFMPQPTHNLALSPTRYAALFSDMTTLLMDDAEILKTYLEGRTPSTADARPAADLRGTPLISLIATPRAELALAGKALGRWPHARGRLGINPIYRETGTELDGSQLLERRFPSQSYVDENREMLDYLPTEVRLEPDVLSALRLGQCIPEMEPHIRSSVIIDLPADYRCTGTATVLKMQGN